MSTAGCKWARNANCHPDREHAALGLCRSCYDKHRYPRRKADNPQMFKQFAENAARQRRANPERYLCLRTKHRATYANLPFSLRPEDIVIPEICPILGIPLKFSLRQAAHNSPSIDRIIPDLGYVPGNIAIISHRANMLKGDGTADEHEKIAAYIRRKS